MKKKSRIFVALSMLCMTLSITAICFSFAWYSVYPTYHNISLSTGNEALVIESRVFTRVRDTSDLPMFSAEKNVKTVLIEGEKLTHKKDGTPVIASAGKLIIDFTDVPLSFNLFGDTADKVADEGIFEPSSFSWNCEYLTFALLECNFYNKLFPAYSTAVYTCDILGENVGTNFDLTDLLQIRIIDDSNVERTKTRIIADPNGDVATSPDLKNLLDNYTNSVDLPLKPLVDDGPDSSQNSAPTHPIFTDDGTTAKQITIKPNTTLNNGVNCYSHAFAIALSVNPVKLFELRKEIKANQKVSLTFSIHFVASNVGGEA